MIAPRVVQRLSDQDYGAPKVLPKMGAVYFNAKVAPSALEGRVGRAGPWPKPSAAFPQWTYLPILPNREETLTSLYSRGRFPGAMGRRHR